MSFVLAGFCAVNCWVIPKLWEPTRVRRNPIHPGPPHGGIVLRICPGSRPAVAGSSGRQQMLLAA
jgi:hypothetical protein